MGDGASSSLEKVSLSKDFSLSLLRVAEGVQDIAVSMRCVDKSAFPKVKSVWIVQHFQFVSFVSPAFNYAFGSSLPEAGRLVLVLLMSYQASGSYVVTSA